MLVHTERRGDGTVGTVTGDRYSPSVAAKATLKVEGLKNVMQRFYDRLHEHREALNRLNVYPVPDGDTGTNMALTVASVVDEVAGAETMEELSTAISHGSLMGARGNSGVILSQILRGLADTFRSAETVGTVQIVDAFDRASTAAYEAVMRPVEGTILTVLRESAEAAGQADTPEGEDLAGLLRRTYDRAEVSLQNTPELLPVLKEAGVVDAGGAGLLLLMAAFLEEVTGEETILPAEIFKAVAGVIAEVPGGEHDISGLRYEVMYFLEASEETLATFKREWMEIGDSIVVVGGDGVYNCHIHTNDIGEALESGIRAGSALPDSGDRLARSGRGGSDASPSVPIRAAPRLRGCRCRRGSGGGRGWDRRDVPPARGPGSGGRRPDHESVHRGTAGRRRGGARGRRDRPARTTRTSFRSPSNSTH